MEKKKILIVEDERIIAEDINRILRRYGYSVVGIASSGEQAIASAKKLKPDIILMDIVLSGSISGIDAAQKINEERLIPIIYITSYMDINNLQSVKDTETFAYIMKPFSERELFVAIELAEYKFRMESILIDTKDKIEKLYAVASKLTSLTTEDQILDIVIQSAYSILGMHKSIIVRKDDDRCEIIKSKYDFYEVGESISISKSDCDEIHVFSDKENLPVSLSADEDNSMIIMGFAAFGLFVAFSENSEEFTANDINLLGLLLGHATEDLKRILLQDELREHAVRDSMTGCYNRFYLFTALEREIIKSHREKNSIAFIMIDVNGLKKINDNYGHHAGDKLLVAVAKILQAASRESDVVVRYGGDEFLLMMPNIMEEAEIVEKRIINKKNEWNNNNPDSLFKVCFAMGSAYWKSDENRSIEDILTIADKKMYEHKKIIKSKN